MKRLTLSLLVAAVLLSVQSTLWSQTNTWSGGSSGSWISPGNWDQGHVPTSSEKVVLSTSAAITDVPTATVGQFQITGGATVSLNCTTAVVLTISGGAGTDLEIAAGCSLSVGTNVTLATSGSFLNNGQISGTGNAALSLAGTDAIDIGSGTSTTLLIGITGSRTVLSAGGAVAGTWEVGAGTLTIPSGVTLIHRGVLANSGTITGAGTLQIEGDISGSGGYSIATVFAGAGNRNVRTSVSITGNVTVNSGTGVRDWGTPVELNIVGTLTNNGTIQDNEGSLTVNVNGSIVNNDSWVNSVTNLTGTGTMSGTEWFGGYLKITSTGDVTLTSDLETGGTLVVDGELTINASVTLTCYSLEVNGKISGVNATSSVILFEGTYGDRFLEFPYMEPGATLSKLKLVHSGSNLALNFSGICNLETGASFELDNLSTLKLVDSETDWLIRAGTGGGSLVAGVGTLIDLNSRDLTLIGTSPNSLSFTLDENSYIYDSYGYCQVVTEGNVTISQGGEFHAPLRVLSGKTTAWNEVAPVGKILPGPIKGAPVPLAKRRLVTLSSTTSLTSFEGTVAVEAGGILSIPSGKTFVAWNDLTVEKNYDVEYKIGAKKNRVSRLNRSEVVNDGKIEGPGSLWFIGDYTTFDNEGLVEAPTTFKDNSDSLKYVTGSGGYWKSLTIEPMSHVIFDGYHTFTGAPNPLVNNGIVELNPGVGIAYDGEAPQTIAPIVYQALHIYTPSGTTLPADVKVYDEVETYTGNLNTGPYKLTLESPAEMEESGGSVVGKAYAVRSVATGVAQNIGGMGFKLNAASYTPFPTKLQTLQARSAFPPGLNVTLTRYTGAAPTMSGQVLIKRYFDAAATGDGLNATLEFFYRTDELNGTTESNLQLYSSTDEGATWAARGGTVDTANNKITLTGVNSLCWWTAGHVNLTPPTLTSISPTSGIVGNRVIMTLTGTNFVSGASTVSFNGSGITVNSVSFVSATQLTANLTIDLGAGTGYRNVSVTTSGGTATLSNAFQVKPVPPPVLRSISPSSGVRGTALSVTFSGSNFIVGSTSVSFGGGITVGSLAVSSSTQAVANITIAAGASAGPRDVTLSTSSGEATLAGGFQVSNPAPTISAVSPTSGVRGQNVTVTVTGTNFESGLTSLNFGTGITVDSIVVVSATQIRARAAVAYDAATGARNVSATNAAPGGGTATLTGAFSVSNPTPSVTTISPATGALGKSVPVTINGNGFITGVTTIGLGTAITVSNIVVVNPAQMTATLAIARGAALGARDLVLTNASPGGGSATLAAAFSVQNPVPTLTRLAPAEGTIGQTLSVVLTGSDFFGGISTVDFGAGITVNSTSVDTGGTVLTANITIAVGAVVGARSISVTNPAPGGGSATMAGSFTVGNPAPTLASVSPVAGGKGQTLSISLVGTNFVTGVTTADFGVGVTVNAVTVSSPTGLTASISIDPNTIAAARSVSVTNAPPGGGKATIAFVFNVLNLAPTIASVSPATGSRGGNSTVTITGTNFSVGSTTVDFGAGITVSSVTVTSPTQMTANLAVAAGASLGVRNVVVTNPLPGGGSATLTNGFTVGNPLPTIASVTPATGFRGQSLTVTVTGTGFFAGTTTVSLGANIDVTSVTIVSPTQLTAAITVATAATTGAKNVEVANPAPGGGTGTLSGGFTVTNPAPTITSIAPATAVRGSSLSVTVSGTQFIAGATSLGLGSDITVSGLTVKSATELQANIAIGTGVSAGAKDVSVTNASPGGGTATLGGGFTVTNPAPTITSVSPTSAGRGSLVNVTVLGTQFISGVTSASFGADISVANISVKSPTEILVSISISSAAATGVRVVSVTNASPGGGSASLPSGFTVSSGPATGIEGNLGLVPDEYVLQEAYPNPFNPSTRVRYGIPEDSRVELIVHNMLGNVVTQLIHGERSKGTYELLWHADNLPSGVYLIRLQAESVESTKRFLASRKVVLVK